MLTFTLDTNCAIAIAIGEGRPEAKAIRALADAHARGKANVALVAITASERQKDGEPLESFVRLSRQPHGTSLTLPPTAATHLRHSPTRTKCLSSRAVAWCGASLLLLSAVMAQGRA